jgi:MoxR-like ATPase
MKSDDADLRQSVARATDSIRARLKGRIVGLENATELILTSIFAGGHCLLVGVPGLAKTSLVRFIAESMDLTFRRIQFTPDLMPSDITGADVIVEDSKTGERAFKFMKGPAFTNILLADEINRTPPKTQAALLEAMEEGTITVGGQRFQLDVPFCVLATQNPIELSGTYPLPAAQLDRFMFFVAVDYPDRDAERDIVRLTTAPELAGEAPPVTREELLEVRERLIRMPVPDDVIRYATTLARRSRPAEPDAPRRMGSRSPRRTFPDDGREGPGGHARGRPVARRRASPHPAGLPAPPRRELPGAGRQRRRAADHRRARARDAVAGRLAAGAEGRPQAPRAQAAEEIDDPRRQSPRGPHRRGRCLSRAWSARGLRRSACRPPGCCATRRG